MNAIKELLVVGIPRSGSTLTAALVDSLENSLCLSEPEGLFITEGSVTKSEYVNSVIDLLSVTRGKVQNGEAILGRRNSDGTPTTNYVKNTSYGERIFEPEKGRVDTSKYNAESMLVAIKHNVPFFSVLPELVDIGIPVIGVIRNPIPTILSWHETRLPVSRGFMPSAEAFWCDINLLFSQSKTPEIGWAKIYDAFCQRMLEADITILKYEDITSNVEHLENVVGRKSVCKVEIRKKSWKDYSGLEKCSDLVDALEKHAPNALHLYPELGEIALKK
jgi:Sulfotransferase domain